MKDLSTEADLFFTYFLDYSYIYFYPPKFLDKEIRNYMKINHLTQHQLNLYNQKLMSFIGEDNYDFVSLLSTYLIVYHKRSLISIYPYYLDPFTRNLRFVKDGYEPYDFVYTTNVIGEPTRPIHSQVLSIINQFIP